METLCEPDEVDSISFDEMYNELLSIGLVDPTATIIAQHKQVIHNTFPIPTFAFNEAVTDNYQTLSNAFNNIYIAGRFAGKSWFHEDVLKDVYFDIKKAF